MFTFGFGFGVGLGLLSWFAAGGVCDLLDLLGSGIVGLWWVVDRDLFVVWGWFRMVGDGISVVRVLDGFGEIGLEANDSGGVINGDFGALGVGGETGLVVGDGVQYSLSDMVTVSMICFVLNSKIPELLE